MFWKSRGGLRVLAPLLLAPFSFPAWAEDPAWLADLRKLRDQPRSAASLDLAWIPQPVAAKLGGPVAELEVPVRLRYLGYKKGTSLEVLRGMKASVASDLESAHHAWLHEDSQSLILSRRAEVFEQLLVWHCARALSVIQARDLALFDELFATQSFDEAALREAQRAGEARRGRALPWLNRRRGAVIVISEASRSIAASIYWLGPSRSLTSGDGKKLPVYENIALLRLNPALILEEGSRNLYSSSDAPLLYLRDGLTESLVHESLHLWIAAQNGSDPVAEAITQAKQQKGKDSFGSGDGGSIEELFVVQSTEAILQSGPWKDASVRPEVLGYYRDVMVKKHHWPRIEALDKSQSRGPSVIFGAFSGKAKEREIFYLPLARARRGE